MERKIKSVITFIIVLGLVIGFASSNVLIEKSGGSQSYCDRVESDVKENKSLNGTLACFEPGLIEVNLSDKVEENSELKCVCRHEYRGVEQILPISISN
mgnify:CR=1 FL=1